MFLLLISLCLVQDCRGNNGNRVLKASCSTVERQCLASLTSTAFNSSVSTSDRSTDSIDVFCTRKKCPSTSFCFMGGCPCHPGYTSSSSTSICDIRLPQNQANRWYTSNCPNLESSSTTTFDMNTPLALTGGENNANTNNICPSHLRSCSYLCYAHDSYGVAAVPTSLWKVSQKAEADLWRINGGSKADSSSNDRAVEHWRSFHYFKCLERDINLGHVIEVGAGPWTQLKGFLNIRSDFVIDSFTIWEPSADRYMKEVASCSYASGKVLRKFDGSGI